MALVIFSYDLFAISCRTNISHVNLCSRYIHKRWFYFAITRWDFFLPVSEAGRKAIKTNNGLQLLYRFCSNCPEDKAYDSLLSRICGIINQCLEKKELPVPEMSPARWTKHSRTREIDQRSNCFFTTVAYCWSGITVQLSDVIHY